jgi:hypothetical protein
MTGTVMKEEESTRNITSVFATEQSFRERECSYAEKFIVLRIKKTDLNAAASRIALLRAVAAVFAIYSDKYILPAIQ